MFAREKLSHVVAVALLLVAVQVITFVEYFGLVDRKENSFASAVGRLVPDCTLTECPSPQAINQTVLNAERDLLAFNMGDSIILYWADLPSRAKSLVFYRSELKNGPWLKVLSLPVTDSMPQQVVDSVIGDRTYWYRAEGLASDGAILKSYSILQVPRYIEDDPKESSALSWKTYHNEEYGFEFRYPPTWQIGNSGVQSFFQDQWGHGGIEPSGGMTIVIQKGCDPKTINANWIQDSYGPGVATFEEKEICKDNFQIFLHTQTVGNKENKSLLESIFSTFKFID